MANRIKLTPVFCAAVGAAVGFYRFGALMPPQSAAALTPVFVMLTAHCLFRVLASVNKESRFLQLSAVCSAAIAVGFVLGICAADAGKNTVKFSLPEEKIIAIEGELLEDPRIISGGKAMATLSLSRCAASGGLRASAQGEVTVFFPQENALTLREFGRGTKVFSEGKFSGSKSGLVYSAKSMHVVKPAPAIERMRTGVRLNLISRFDGKPWGGLALALLLGIKDNLDSNLSAMYRDAGCSYILALSGMHLAVLAALIAFLLKRPLGLKAASIAGALIICLYCFIVGPMPSLNRAALMYLLGVVAVLGALPREPMSILSLSFLIQLVITPAAGDSLSFILSYLALAGILVIGQPLYRLFCGKAPDFLLQPLSASCGAFLATAGVSGFAFGVLAPVGIVVGLVLVPLTTVFMIGSMVWLVLDLIHLSVILSFPLSLLYRLMEGIVSASGSAPGLSAWPLAILSLSIALSLLIAVFEYRRRAALVRLKPFPC
jgi:competence protein ComEC